MKTCPHCGNSNLTVLTDTPEPGWQTVKCGKPGDTFPQGICPAHFQSYTTDIEESWNSFVDHLTRAKTLLVRFHYKQTPSFFVLDALSKGGFHPDEFTTGAFYKDNPRHHDFFNVKFLLDGIHPRQADIFIQ